MQRPNVIQYATSFAGVSVGIVTEEQLCCVYMLYACDNIIQWLQGRDVAHRTRNVPLIAEQAETLAAARLCPCV